MLPFIYNTILIYFTKKGLTKRAEQTPARLFSIDIYQCLD